MKQALIVLGVVWVAGSALNSVIFITDNEASEVTGLDVRVGNPGYNKGVYNFAFGFPLGVELLDCGDVVSNDVVTTYAVSFLKHLKAMLEGSRRWIV